MSQVTDEAAHPDFPGPADTILFSADCTAFHIAWSDLTRCSAYFRTHVPGTLRRRDSTTHTAARIDLEEDTLTLEILLKLGCGRSAGLARLAHLHDLERVLNAATRYEMEGAEDVLLLLLRLPRMQEDALHLYAIAGRYGQAELEHNALQRLVRLPLNVGTVMHVDVAQLARLVSSGQQRIERFCALLLQTQADAPFGREYAARCPYNTQPSLTPLPSRSPAHCDKTPQSHLAWERLVSALQSAFVRHPSVAALDADPLVRSRQRALSAICCDYSSCYRPQYDWQDICARLSASLDASESDPASCIVIA